MSDERSVDREVQVKIDVVSDSLQYIGEAPIGASTAERKWKIQRISVSGNVTSVQWAEGSMDFTNRWDDRAAYSYS